MQERSLRSVLRRLGLTQTEVARLTGVSSRTVGSWITGCAPIPGPVKAYLRVLQAAGSDMIERELRSISGRGRRMDEGIYGLFFRSDDGSKLHGGAALAVLRDGKILGADRGGGVFTGSYAHDTDSGANSVSLKLRLPPRGTMVTGYTAEARGAVIDVCGSFDRAAPVSTVIVNAAGRPIEVELNYLGPLPH